MHDRGPNVRRAAILAALGFLVGLLGPPLVWLATLELVYGVAAFACDVGVSRLPMQATATVMLAVIAATVVASWRHVRASETVATTGAPGLLSNFVSAGGLVLTAQFLIVVVAQKLAIVFLGPCR